MRRAALVLIVGSLVVAAGLVVAGCGGEEEATPTPTDTTGTIPTDTETTDTTETTETDGEEPVEGDAEAGKQIFVANCGTCHMLADAGTSGTIGPNLDDSAPARDLVIDRVTNGQGVMPAFGDTLSEEDIQNVAAYVVEATG